jgi:hypothetical protein
MGWRVPGWGTVVRSITVCVVTGLLSVLAAPLPAALASAEASSSEAYDGVLTGSGLGLHIAKTTTWRADHPFKVVPGVESVTATLEAHDELFGSDYWVTIVGPDRETVTRSPGATAGAVEARLDWPAIERNGWGSYSAVVECGLCGTLQYHLELRTTWAQAGVNLTVDDDHLLVVPEAPTRTGVTITNTGLAPARFSLEADGLPSKWRLSIPVVPIIASHQSLSLEIGLEPRFHVKEGTRVAFDLVVRDVAGAAADRVHMEAAYTAELARLRSASNVVIADIEPINPYHEEFRGAPSTQEHPSWFVDGYPSGAKALPLTLDAPTYEEALARDRPLWENLTADTLYFVPGTRIIGFICMGGCGVPALDTGGHGTGTASLAAGRTLGEDPEALIVSVGGDFFRGARWAARQPWIDVITLSLGAFVGTCTLGETCQAVGAGTGNPYVPFSMPWAQRLAYESGKRFFTGSSQGWVAWAGPAGANGPCPYMWSASFAGTPWTYAVETYWPWTEQPWRSSCFPPEVVAQGWDLVAASAGSMDRTNGFGHTSGATPQAAGAYARTIHEARRSIGATQEGARPFVSALSSVSLRLGDAQLGVAAQDAELPSAGPGADGLVTVNEVEKVYQHALEQVDVLASFARHGSDPRWQSDVMPVLAGEEFAQEGFGLLTDAARSNLVAMAKGEMPSPPRPDDDAAYAAHFAFRLAFWEPQVQNEVWVF